MKRDDRSCRFRLAAWAAAACFLVPGGGALVPVLAAGTEPASVPAAIRVAYGAGKKKVVIPPGVYRFQPTNDHGHLAFSDLADFEIDASGATFVWQGQTEEGLRFAKCRNVKLRGATLQRGTAAFTQGTVAAIAPDGKSCDVRIDAGYPNDADDPKSFGEKLTAHIFDPKLRQWKASTPDFACTRVERLGEGRFRLSCEPALAAERVNVGDLFVLRRTCAPEINIVDCHGIDIADVTIQGAGGVGVKEEGGEGGGHYTFSVTYGSRPAGAGVDPLVASASGAFGSHGVRRGPVLEGCYFEGTCGDGIAIHGAYARVDHAEGKTLFVDCVTDRVPFRPGEPICLYDRQGAPAGRAVVRAIEAREGTKAAKDSVHPSFTKGTLHEFALILDEAAAAESDFLVSAPGACGAGYVARSNSIRNHRGRGLYLGAADGVVEKNFLDGSTIAGIVLAPDLAENEADYSRKVVIRNNTIRHAGYATTGPRSEQVGALTVAGGRGLGHEGIRIEGNTFLTNAGVNLQIEHARDVLVVNNRFNDANRTPCRSGSERGIDPEAIIWMSDCRGIRFEGNTYKGRGPFGKQVVGVSATAEFDGLKGGMLLDR
ncbi:MAG: right-handed parallel beta-helix repeat-containing protein [Isosphaeraceae bacterium]|nr:right-handed parallel beta-helix repeat-containing protein [Isosphaeraceae bacterium]